MVAKQQPWTYRGPSWLVEPTRHEHPIDRGTVLGTTIDAVSHGRSNDAAAGDKMLGERNHTVRIRHRVGIEKDEQITGGVCGTQVRTPAETKILRGHNDGRASTHSSDHIGRPVIGRVVHHNDLVDAGIAAEGFYAS